MVKTTLMIMLQLALLSSFCAADEASIQKGQEAYLAYGCAVCHGKDGRGDGINARNFDPSPTNFHHKKNYHYGHEKADIIYSIRNGVNQQNHAMPAFYHLSKQELEDIAKYLISLESKGNP